MRTRVAIVLCAGVGSRLRPMTDDRPKALVDIGGESIVERAIRLLAAYGVQKVILATGYQEETLRHALSDAPLELVYCHNPQYDRTQNSVSLALCRHAAEGAAFFKLDGDLVFSAEVLERLDAPAEPLAAAVDFGRAVDAEAMKVCVRPDRRIVSFGKGIDLLDAAGESIGIERLGASAGQALFSALEREMSAGRTDLYYEDVYSSLIGDGLEARAVDVSDLPWTEVDTLADLEQARALSAKRL